MRQRSEPNWSPPRDLMARVTVADTRERILAASDAKRYAEAVTLAAATPSLLTCGDVEVLWRVAEAFGQTDRRSRALDAYRYILTTCSDPDIRLATLQKAAAWLSPSELGPLQTLGADASTGDGFRSIREAFARDAVTAAAEDPARPLGAADLKLFQAMAEANGAAADALLVGNFFLHRDNFVQAEHWYRLAFARNASASSANALAVALLALKRPAEAETLLSPWQKNDDEARRTYLRITADLLSARPPASLSPGALSRMAAAVAAKRDVSLAQEFGWYAHSFKQDVTALRWFATALSWRPDDETSAYGFAVVSRSMGRRDALNDVVKAWGSRSPRIRALAQLR
ncbi:hypothetical protein J8I29_25010 [Labrys sp. LIt4]|nr:hypothetical protein [Labrys sp. LIt4]